MTTQKIGGEREWERGREGQREGGREGKWEIQKKKLVGNENGSRFPYLFRRHEKAEKYGAQFAEWLKEARKTQMYYTRD